MLAVSAAVTQACSPPSAPPAAADENGVVLRDGFTSRVIARAGEPVTAGGAPYRVFPDGAATFVDPAVPGGWYLCVNHEIPGTGGVTSIRFAPDGTVVGAAEVLSGTGMNCAGGATPWGTWLSCEEFDWGHVWECDPTGSSPARRHRAMGAFAHEAAAVAADGRVYLTEDRSDGGFYRFTPSVPGELSRGLLEVATGAAPGPVVWRPVPDPDPGVLSTPCRRQLDDTMHFDGGEGIATLGDDVWFTTKGDDRIWRYDLADDEVVLHYRAGGTSPLSGVDNLWVDGASGALLVAEDGGDMEVVVVHPDGTAEAIVALPGQEELSEVTGPCFSPDGQRLYFSSQRNPVGPAGLPLGVTYEVTGPFDDLLGRS